MLPSQHLCAVKDWPLSPLFRRGAGSISRVESSSVAFQPTTLADSECREAGPRMVSGKLCILGRREFPVENGGIRYGFIQLLRMA